MASNCTRKFATIKTWALRLLALDGALPVVVVILPHVVQHAFPKVPHALPMFATLVLAIGCVYRFYAGRHHILTNQCGRVFRIVQTVALIFGIVLIVFNDCLIMVLKTMPGDALSREFGLMVFVYVVYLLSMAFALYPGRLFEPNKTATFEQPIN